MIAFRKVWRDLWNYKGRTLLVVLSIAVGVMALGMTLSSNALLRRSILDSRAASHKPDARLSFLVPLNDDAVAAVLAMSEISAAEGRISASLRWRPGAAGPWRDALLTAAPDYAHQQFDRLELMAGRWPGRDEIAIEYNHPEFWGAPPLGGTVWVEVNNHPLALTLVGAVRDPLVIPPPFTPINQTPFYVSRLTAERLTGSRDFNQLSIQVSARSAGLDQTITAVQAKLKRLGVVSTADPLSSDRRDPTGNYVLKFMDGLGVILVGMAVFSLALSITLVVNTINAIVAQQVTQIGIMKTVGGRFDQITLLYLSGAAIYGLLSLLIAVPLGLAGGYVMAVGWLSAFNVPLPPFEVEPGALAAQAAVGLLAPLAAALWPVVQGVSVPVRQAIAAYGLGTGHYGLGRLDRLMGSVAGLPRMAALALRNTFRRTGRVALTEITLLCAGAVYMMVTATGVSFNKTLDDVWASWGFDVIFIFDNYHRSAGLDAALAAQPGVAGLELWSWAQTKAHRPGLTDPADQYELQVHGAPPGSRMFHPTLLAGRLLRPDDGHALVLNQKVARSLGVDLGDTLTLEYGAGKSADWQIVGLVRDLGANGTEDTAFVWQSILNVDTGLSGRANVAQLITRDSSFETQDRVKNQVKNYLETQKIGVTLSSGQQENKRLAGMLWSLIGNLLQLMTVLVAAVGSIGLSGTLSINVMERRREIGVMRAVGASSGDVAAIFMGEGLLLGVISWALAVPFSMTGARFFVDALSEALNFPFNYQYSYTGMWTWLAIILILSVLASWWPARRATQISVRESLAYE